MIDLASISQDVLLARGQYSTVRAAHEDAKKELSILCGQLSSVSSQILKRMQPDNDAVPDDVESLIDSGKQVLQRIEACAKQVEDLAHQRGSLYLKAWK